jgi:hypothetical protein
VCEMTYFLCRKTEGELDDKLELRGIKQKHEAKMRKKISGLNIKHERRTSLRQRHPIRCASYRVYVKSRRLFIKNNAPKTK